MDALELDIRKLIIEALGLEDLRPEQIDPEAPLFGEGLGLDSIDALELGVALRKKYRLRLEAADPETRQHFRSVKSLAAFVKSSGEGNPA